MEAVWIILVAFGGIGGLVVVVALAVLVGVGRITIPGTAEHELKKAETALTIEERKAESLLLVAERKRLVAIKDGQTLALTQANLDESLKQKQITEQSGAENL